MVSSSHNGVAWGMRWLAIVSVMGSIVGCEAPGPEESTVLRIAAASDLQDVMPKLIASYRATREISLEASYGSSGTLFQQIREGAPFDLFLSADRRLVEQLAKQELIARDTVRPYATGTLALVSSRDAPTPCKAVVDLANAGVRRIAIANPERAPYGAAAKQVLERAGIWKSVEAKLVYADNVRQALQFVQTGNADAGLVGSALARSSGLDWQPVYVTLYDPIVQCMGVVASSRRGGEARSFAEFIVGKTGQAIMAEYGFHPLAPSDETP